MIMWHYGEPVEIAAFQLLNVLFSVPQVSVRLQEIPKDHCAMVRFYTDYWRRQPGGAAGRRVRGAVARRELPGRARPRAGGKQIVGLYGDAVIGLDGGGVGRRSTSSTAKNSQRVVLCRPRDLGRYRYTVRDSQGRTVESRELTLAAGARAFVVPVSGLLSLERVAARP